MAPELQIRLPTVLTVPLIVEAPAKVIAGVICPPPDHIPPDIVSEHVPAKAPVAVSPPIVTTYAPVIVLPFTVRVPDTVVAYTIVQVNAPIVTFPYTPVMEAPTIVSAAFIASKLETRKAYDVCVIVAVAYTVTLYREFVPLPGAIEHDAPICTVPLEYCAPSVSAPVLYPTLPLITETLEPRVTAVDMYPVVHPVACQVALAPKAMMPVPEIMPVELVSRVPETVSAFVFRVSVAPADTVRPVQVPAATMFSVQVDGTSTLGNVMYITVALKLTELPDVRVSVDPAVFTVILPVLHVICPPDFCRDPDHVQEPVIVMLFEIA